MVIEVGILVTAFTLQLLALPGEKAQFIISALSTKYKPLSVAIGASMAFGLWTIVEIVVGSELKGTLPKSFLDGATAVVLVVFAGLIVRDAYTTGSFDFSESERVKKVAEKVPDRFEGGVLAFLVILFGEFGDKTQIITISLAAEYGLSYEVWIGEMLAIVPISVLNAYAVARFSAYYNSDVLKYVATVILVIFAADIALEQVTGNSFLPL